MIYLLQPRWPEEKRDGVPQLDSCRPPHVAHVGLDQLDLAVEQGGLAAAAVDLLDEAIESADAMAPPQQLFADIAPDEPSAQSFVGQHASVSSCPEVALRRSELPAS